MTDHQYFEIIDTPTKAYWLGFLWADGHITKDGYKIEITLHTRDEGHLELLKKDLELVNKFGRNPKRPNEVRLKWGSVKMVSDLSQYGFTHNKSLYNSLPVIPDRFESHYIRGVIDGDGSFMRLETPQILVQIVNSKKACSKFLDIIHTHTEVSGGSIENHPNNNFTGRMRIGGRNQFRSVVSWLYQDAEIFLDRKRELVKEIVGV